MSLLVTPKLRDSRTRKDGLLELKQDRTVIGSGGKKPLIFSHKVVPAVKSACAPAQKKRNGQKPECQKKRKSIFRMPLTGYCSSHYDMINYM